MSIMSSLDITVPGTFSAFDMLSILKKNGWTWLNKDMQIEFISLHDEDDFDWMNEKMSDEQFLDLIRQKETDHEQIGVQLYHNNREVGVTFLAKDSIHFSFLLNYNRVKLANSHDIGVTNINWYITELLWKLLSQGVNIQQLQFEEII